MAAKLKVYITRIGFHDVAVAAPNQKAALSAWDIRENLFAKGAASVADDPAAIKSARAEPGRPVSRAIGESGAFKAVAEAPSKAPKVKAPARARMKAAAKTPKPPDRRRLDAAEKALADFDKDRKKRLARSTRPAGTSTCAKRRWNGSLKRAGAASIGNKMRRGGPMRRRAASQLPPRGRTRPVETRRW